MVIREVSQLSVLDESHNDMFLVENYACSITDIALPQQK